MTYILGCVGSFVTFALVSSSTPETQNRFLKERTQFIRELSILLLDNDGPRPLAKGKGWTGIVLVAPGTSLSPAITSFDSFGNALSNNAQALADSYLFDRPLIVEKGLCLPATRGLSEIWEDVLRRSIPKLNDLGEDFARLQPDAAKWLFMIPDKVDQARGVRFAREPSIYFRKYREYELVYQLLLSSDSGIGMTNESWKLLPRLARYATVEEARKAVLDDWIKFGYKCQIEDARATFNKRMNVESWSSWSEASERYKADLIFYDRNRRVARTLLSPAPTEWLKMGSWIHATTKTSEPQISITFEIARIKVVRRWFQVDDLVLGKLKIDADKDFDISDGKAPTLVDYPTGIMSVYPEELLVVRNIRYEGSASNSSHVLTMFAERDSIKIIGYVVRALPGIMVRPSASTKAVGAASPAGDR